jgi:hypothetical protein
LISCRTTAKEKKPSQSRQFDTPICNGGFDFQSRRFFAFAQTNDDLQGHGSDWRLIYRVSFAFSKLT